jgi:hypothetical protein
MMSDREASEEYKPDLKTELPFGHTEVNYKKVLREIDDEKRDADNNKLLAEEKAYLEKYGSDLGAIEMGLIKSVNTTGMSSDDMYKRADEKLGGKSKKAHKSKKARKTRKVRKSKKSRKTRK